MRHLWSLYWTKPHWKVFLESPNTELSSMKQCKGRKKTALLI